MTTNSQNLDCFITVYFHLSKSSCSVGVYLLAHKVDVLLEYVDLWLVKHYLLCLMFPATYYAQKYASIIGM